MSPTIEFTTDDSEDFDVVYRSQSDWVAGVDIHDEDFDVDVFHASNILKIDSDNVHITDQPRSIQHYDEELEMSPQEMLDTHDWVSL